MLHSRLHIYQERTIIGVIINGLDDPVASGEVESNWKVKGTTENNKRQQ